MGLNLGLKKNVSDYITAIIFLALFAPPEGPISFLRAPPGSGKIKKNGTQATDLFSYRVWFWFSFGSYVVCIYIYICISICRFLSALSPSRSKKCFPRQEQIGNGLGVRACASMELEGLFPQSRWGRPAGRVAGH